ncbi:MAG TPA: BON domain-containing protein, partial [Polyangiaceae bacterium]|nr:BON domain-containing protein [Polyangiaceae bacterium]
SSDPVTARQRIAVRAHHDGVHLSGDVDSMGTRRIAERDVLAIPGVRDVFDDLAVRPQPLPDEGIVAAVERIMHDDPWLDDSAVGVSARGGVVELAGRVASAAERARAEDDAREASPAGVDVSALQIETVFRDDGTLRATPGWASSDRDIAQALRDAYVIDPRVRCAPTVEVRDRVVVLTGVAPTWPALRAAEEDALNVPGVASVRDDLRERPSVVEEDDGALRADVVAIIARDPQLGTLHVAVQALRGRVFLRGSVPTETDRRRAIALASSAPGAVDVDDDGLAVVPARLAGDRHAALTGPTPPSDTTH